MANIIEMPKLSDTMTVGTLVKWLKNEGDAVKNGDMLAEVETDKATMELECFFDGTLLKIFAEAGSQVELGEPLCAVGKAGETVDAPAKKSAPAAAPKEEETKSEAPAADETEERTEATGPVADTPPAGGRTPEEKTAEDADESPAPAKDGGRVRISPLARKLAAEKGVDPARVKGSGPGGRIVRADILAAAARPDSQKPTRKFEGGGLSGKGPIQEARTAPVSNMRGAIARRLLESKTQLPHFYVDIDIDAAPLLALREQLNTGLEKEGVKLSVNDFILKASAEALRKVPIVNSSWETQASGQASIRYHGAAHVAFAVAIEEGLITPVIRDAHLKSVFAISSEAKSLGKLAKEKKLKPDQYTGGTFCVSNLGMMGIPRFTAIINPPNVAILAVGTTVTKPVVKDGQIAIGQTMTLTLSCDHRVVDGAVGAAYLNALRDLLEKPALLLV